MEPEKNRSYERRYENEVLLSAEASDVFAFVVDHTRLSSHMSKPTWMMGGGHMETSVDSGLGQKVGSQLHILIEYNVPRNQAWLGKLFGGYYAKWCVTQMMRSASDYFKESSKH